jgi:hypothetical protein
MDSAKDMWKMIVGNLALIQVRNTMEHPIIPGWNTGEHRTTFNIFPNKTGHRYKTKYAQSLCYHT